MNSLLKKLRFLNHRYFYISVVLMIVFTLLVYPPSVGNASPQSGKRISTTVVYKSPLMFSNPRIDSLRASILKVDSNINQTCTKIVKQQETIKTIIIKQ